jgi:hypothetical protein
VTEGDTAALLPKALRLRRDGARRRKPQSGTGAYFNAASMRSWKKLLRLFLTLLVLISYPDFLPANPAQ